MSELTAFDDEDIPADIWATAEGMALESDGHPGVWSLKESLARAIYIERERAAACCHTALGDNFVMTGPSGIARQIENAIRTHK